MVLTHPNLSFSKLFPSLIAIREGAGGELKIAIRDHVMKGGGRVKENGVSVIFVMLNKVKHLLDSLQAQNDKL